MAQWIAACVDEYFKDSEIDQGSKDNSLEDPIYTGYKAVLDSKSIDETLVICLHIYSLIVVV